MELRVDSKGALWFYMFLMKKNVKSQSINIQYSKRSLSHMRVHASRRFLLFIHIHDDKYRHSTALSIEPKLLVAWKNNVFSAFQLFPTCGCSSIISIQTSDRHDNQIFIRERTRKEPRPWRIGKNDRKGIHYVLSWIRFEGLASLSFDPLKVCSILRIQTSQ